MPKSSTTGTRFLLLDEIRGFAIICMVFFHGFYLLGYILGFSVGIELFEFFMPAEPFFAGAFIVISGMCCRFSHSNIKRGLILFAVAILLTAATIGLTRFGIDEIIKFGILHLLAVSILIFALLRPVLNKIPALLQIIIFLVLFIITLNVENGYIGIANFSLKLPAITHDQVYLFPFGLRSVDFASSDYFPILPWTFLFLAGSAFGIYGQRGKFPYFFCTSHIKPLQFAGRYSLWIYLFHQPVLFLLAQAIKVILKLG